ncbi:hypothetical protein JOC36_001505 [Weissella uvarum]|uniref:YopX family protein n=1 Tax=Weissella uvarum TaxID=1479233 RepID=UPI0019604901|nr:YopX family protein [Weissella uvarum]MBM7617912.1 hypothetical protein [Weissella uvarum]MCM0596091.1 hypothetical protein [Weissella uvarum]
MEKKLKFRIWLEREGEKPKAWYNTEDDATAFVFDDDDKLWIYEEYTGLQDINNEPIFEGDIVVVDSENSNHVHENCVIQGNGEIFVVYIPSVGQRIPLEGQGMGDFKIVGNINENPEMLD